LTAIFVKSLQNGAFMASDRVIPEAGIAPPESGFQGIAGDASFETILRNINKNKEILI
jgi:hypothetical protein